MAAYNKFHQFVEDLGKGVHNLDTGDLTIALTTVANTPSASGDAVLTDISEITYTNLSTRDLDTEDYEQTSGVAKLVAADLVLSASGNVAAFANFVLYNDTPTSPADPMICWWESGVDTAMVSGETYTLDFDDTNGILIIE
jgi:hypothetical protein